MINGETPRFLEWREDNIKFWRNIGAKTEIIRDLLMGKKNFF